MQPLTTSDITKATINTTRSEAAAITFPRDFPSVAWGDLDFYGWRDPRIERRGYLVAEHEGRLVTVLLSTSENRMSGRRKVMCAICRAVDNGSNIALFAARRAGRPGRDGNTVGTYICSGLDCSAQLRQPPDRASRTQLPDGYGSVEERAAAMLERLAAFLAAVG